MSIGNFIQSDLEEAVGKAGFSGEVRIVSTTGERYGDYTTSWALQQSKVLGKSPTDLAVRVINSIPDSDIYEPPELVTPGFINFRLKKGFLGKHLKLVLAEGDRFGSSNSFKGKRALVEYSSPNIAKPMHVGHLRNTNIGQAILNTLSFVGYETISDNHLGDWGTQFGRMLWAYKMWGHRVRNPSVQDLLNLYVRFHEEAKTNSHLLIEANEEFMKLEQGDKENRSLWEQFTKISLNEFNRIYDDLGAKFDYSHGESFYEKDFANVADELVKSGVAIRDPDGSIVAKFEDMPPLVMRKSDGATLYAIRDLATAKYRRENFDPDLVVLVVAVEQSLYWRQLFEIMNRANWMGKAEYVHASYGLTRLKGGKMSTRAGDVVSAEELIKEAKVRAEELIVQKRSGSRASSKLIRDIAIGSIKWADLKIGRDSGVVFDWETAFSMDGNSGPYIQYSFARTQSILRKTPKSDERVYDTSLLVEDDEMLLLRMLTKFPEVVEGSARSLAPQMLCQYAFSLAQQFSRFYENIPVLSSERKVKTVRLALVAAVGITLRNSLSLLGIPTPDRV
jgi:arginyl-tRNA synthetase